MPTTDQYGQGVPIASLSDAPDAKKLASDMTDGLNGMVSRSVMRFASAAARNATLTSPVAGMTAFLADSQLLTVYDGTTWTVVAAGMQSWTTVSLASGWSHNGNDNGNFQYRLVNLFGSDSIMFSGAIGRSSYPSSVPGSFVITSTALPVAARPSTLRTVSVPCSDINSSRITLKLDLRTDGHLEIFGTGSGVKPPWVGFNGVFCRLL